MTENNTNRLIFIFSFSALCFALVLEYFFGLLPCKLCTYQRIPYLIIIFIFIFQIALKPSKKLITILISICLLVEIYFSLNHTLLSLGVINSFGCESAVELPSDINELKNALQNNTLIIDCEKDRKSVV